MHRPIFPDGELLTRAMGEELGRWARGESIQNPHEELWAHATVEAETGTGALRTFWTGCTRAERRALRPINERLKVTADEADRILGIETGWRNRGGEVMDVVTHGRQLSAEHSAQYREADSCPAVVAQWGNAAGEAFRQGRKRSKGAAYTPRSPVYGYWCAGRDNKEAK